MNKVTDKNIDEGLEFVLQLPILDHVLHQVLSLRAPKQKLTSIGPLETSQWTLEMI